jgi:(R,R)-butanediol dehydrogenase/meso-butanediol dehydrogenase/diacetyl reductase
VIGLPLQECDECRPSGQGCRDRLGILCPRNRVIGLGAAVPGAYAEYLRMPAHHAVKIPDGLDLKQAALTEPLAVGAHAVRAAGNLLGARVLVIGAGPIGLAVTLLAQLAGAREVMVSEIAPGRRAKAASIGATVVEKPGPAEVIFECVGVPGLLRQCIDLAPLHGQIIVVGVCRGEDQIFPRVALRKELNIRFVLGYTRDEFAMVLDLLASGRIDPAPLITGVIGLDETPAMFEALRKPGDHAKVLIDPAL